MGDFASDTQAVTAIEYGLIAALFAMAIIAIVGIVGTDLTGIFGSVANSL